MTAITEVTQDELRPDPGAGLSALGSLPEHAPPPATFEIVARDEQGDARSGRLWTAHGVVETPCFMPVGTYGAVKGLLPEELRAIGSQVILANAYHLTHRPGPERIREVGGIHRFMHWAGPILTDSGGYQVFSLRSLQKIDEGGVDYHTHFDGAKARMTPRSVLEAEAKIGPDICMILDHCPPGDAEPSEIRVAMERTTRWAREAAELRRGILAPWQLCFAICQGGTNLALRREHLAALAELDFDGFALGGLSVGEPIPEMHATFAAIVPLMPVDKPRYVMGIGTPADLLAAVRSGVDMFDCVIPTRHARNGQLLTVEGRLNLRNARFRTDDDPPDPACACPTCRRFSRSYLRHLHVHSDPLYVRLASIHNLFFFHQWVAAMRQAIRRGRFQVVAARMAAMLGPV
ncbi:tRNA guanosine(34) transglycosylase Tgt [Nannocystaceae bacterium ST9]